jgi:hypothetical protein
MMCACVRACVYMGVYADLSVPEHQTKFCELSTRVLLVFRHEMLRQKDIVPILIYIQQDATLHSLFYMQTALHVSGGTTTHHQERKQMYLQHLVFVTPLLLTATIAAGSSNGVTNIRCCRYSFLRS